MDDGPDTGYESWHEPPEDNLWAHEMSDEPEQPEEETFLFHVDATVKVSASSYEEAIEKLNSTSQWEDWDLRFFDSPE